MPTLDWIGRSAVVEHHKQVPFRLLKCDSRLSHGDAESDNLLIQGDNLEALKALLPYYAGQVKCIYIDPPTTPATRTGFTTTMSTARTCANGWAKSSAARARI